MSLIKITGWELRLNFSLNLLPLGLEDDDLHFNKQPGLIMAGKIV